MYVEKGIEADRNKKYENTTTMEYRISSGKPFHK